MATTRFSIDVRRWAAKTGLSIEQTVRASTLEIFTRVVRKSPVDTGRFRGNWNIDQRGFVYEKYDKSGAAAIAEITEKVQSSEVGGIISLINNLPYAERLEFGHSKQAPEGMVRLTALEFGSIVEDEAAKERR